MRKRILVVRPFRIDKVEAASVAELELDRSRRRNYKWLKEWCKTPQMDSQLSGAETFTE